MMVAGPSGPPHIHEPSGSMPATFLPKNFSCYNHEPPHEAVSLHG